MYNYLVIFADGLITQTTNIDSEIMHAADRGKLSVIDITNPAQPCRWDHGWKTVEGIPERI